LPVRADTLVEIDFQGLAGASVVGRLWEARRERRPGARRPSLGLGRGEKPAQGRGYAGGGDCWGDDRLALISANRFSRRRVAGSRGARRVRGGRDAALIFLKAALIFLKNGAR